MSDLLDALTLGLQNAFNSQAIFFILLAIGLNVHFGYVGLLNFGQIAYASLGAFGVAISVTTWGLPLWVGVLIGLAASVVLALLLGLPTLRLRADYLAIVTIAAAEILRLVLRSVGATPVTGGSRGLQGFTGGFADLQPWPNGTYRFLGMNWSGYELWVSLVGWILVALLSLLVWGLVRSPWGRVLKAIREDEDAVRALGKNVYAFKMQALILGGLIGCVGGIIFGLSLASINPDNFNNGNTFLAYTALILGGAARTWGPIVGGMILLFLVQFADTGLRALISNGVIPETLLSTTDVAGLRFVIIGVGLMALLVFRPQGLFGDRREVMIDAR
ncbi:branched-chain amino acid ABC transporter permease [Blastococcus sp. SYSU D00820]